tara:strand:- start:172 stop:450 length:279 start_codon:yes stop_codon:yes gene_type:complete
MSEEVKFTDDELGQVKEMQDNYFNVQNEFGQLSMSRIRLEKQLVKTDQQEDELHQKLIEIENAEKSFLDEITKKYGKGTLNPETGVFIPEKS